MRPLDFYEFGVRLASSASSEAEHRTAISRIYYGLHHEACCRYFRENQDAEGLQRGSRHQRLVETFHNAEDSAASDVAIYLQQLSRMRNVADYELGQDLQYNRTNYTSEQFMRIALNISEQLKQALDTFSPGEAPDGCECRVGRNIT